MIETWTHVIYLDSWYRINSLEPHMYKMNECCQYAGFALRLTLFSFLAYLLKYL